MRWIVSPWTTIENTTTAKVIFRISGFQELSGSDTASASDRPPRRPPHVNSLVKPRQSARIAPTALRPPTIAETVSARAKSTAVIATAAGTPGVTPTRGLIRTTWNPTNTNSRAFIQPGPERAQWDGRILAQSRAGDVAAEQAGDDGGDRTRDVEMLGGRIHARHCAERDEQTRMVRVRAEHQEVDDQPAEDAQDGPAEHLPDKDRSGAAPGRRAAADCHACEDGKEDHGDPVVEQGLAIDHRLQILRQADFRKDREGRNRIGGGDQCPEQQSL